MNYKTKMFSKSDFIELHDKENKHGEVVFSCSINDYTLEVSVFKDDKKSFESFLQAIKKNGVEIDVPMLLSWTALSLNVQKQRWEDLVYVINKLEKTFIDIEEVIPLSLKNINNKN